MSRILIVNARFYDDIADCLQEGAEQALKAARVQYETASVPGALEIPTAISMAMGSKRFSGYVALGCVIRGETSHYDTVCEQSAWGLQYLGIKHRLAIGNGILTTENHKQALKRAHPAKGNKGGDAVAACLHLIDLAGGWTVREQKEGVKEPVKEQGSKEQAVKDHGVKEQGGGKEPHQKELKG
jgi:6,7-dimethyl-8-ribityllumazine synthase